MNTLIRFGKFEEIIVLMAKTCNFDSEISDFNSVDLTKGQNFFQRPNLKAKGKRPKIQTL